MIELTLRKQFPDFLLETDLELPLEPLAVLGPSGSGKSTLLNCVAGLVEPDAGRIALDGLVLFDSGRGINLAPERRQIGYVFQDGLLFPHLTIRDNLLYGYRRARGKRRRISLEEAVEVLNIGHLLDRRPATLSGGERQRVALGRALLTSPRLLLFDEPLASIDKDLKLRILPYLCHAISHFKIPTLYVSHDREEATRVATNLLVLRDGRVLACGPYLEIIDEAVVYQALTPGGLENLIPASLIADRPDLGYAEVTAGQTVLKVASFQAPPGERIMLSLWSNEVILSRSRPERISARNILPGTVEQLVDVGNLILVHLDVGFELVVELTAEAVFELELEPGCGVWALIKSNSFTIEITRRRAPGPDAW